MKIKLEFDTLSDDYQKSDVLTSINGLDLGLCILNIRESIRSKVKWFSNSEDHSEDYNEGYAAALIDVQELINETINDDNILDTLNSIQ